MDTLNDALLLWQDILEPGDPEQTRINLGQWEARRTLEDLNECLRLDRTGVTSAMILLGMFEGYVRDWALTFREILDGEVQTDAKFLKCRRLDGLLQAADIQEPIAAFKGEVLSGLKAYDAKADAAEMANDSISLGILRRDALVSFDRLAVHQFAQGKAKDKSGGFNPSVYEFLNVNSAIEAVIRSGQTGITMALIRDSDGEDAFSFFAFICWNGGTLTVLTDKIGWVHPKQKGMIRCPGRRISEEIEKNRFPYQLAGIQWSSDGKAAWVPERRGLINWQFKMNRLAPINSLEPDQVVWLSMMFDLMRRKYFKQNVQMGKLSYTAEMCFQRIAANPDQALIALTEGKVIELPDIHVADLTAENLADQWESKPTGHNRWLEARFADKLTDNLINVTCDDAGEMIVPDKIPHGLKKWFGPIKHDWRGHETGDSLRSVLSPQVPTEFGTREQLLRDQQWAARFNQAVIINRLAEADFKKRNQWAKDWWNDHVQANKAALIDAAIAGELKCETILLKQFARRERNERANTNLVSTWKYEPSGRVGRYEFTGGQYYYGQAATAWIDDGRFSNDHYSADYLKHYCCRSDDDTMARVFIVIGADTPMEIAAIVGMEVEQMPIEFQNCWREEPYGGNSILDRLDPMDWVVGNYWGRLNPRAIVCLSRREFQKGRRALGLPDFTADDFKAHRR
jgi:hypothetical protein